MVRAPADFGDAPNNIWSLPENDDKRVCNCKIYLYYPYSFCVPHISSQDTYIRKIIKIEKIREIQKQQYFRPQITVTRRSLNYFISDSVCSYLNDGEFSTSPFWSLVLSYLSSNFTLIFPLNMQFSTASFRKNSAVFVQSPKNSHQT